MQLPVILSPHSRDVLLGQQSAVSRDTPPSQVSAGSYLLPQSTFIERVNNNSIQSSKYLAVQTKTLKTSRRLPRCLRVVSAGAGEDRATVCDLLT